MKSSAFLIVLILSALGGGCAPDSNETSTHEEPNIYLDIYYRDFDELSPIAYSDEDLIRSAKFRIRLNGRNAIFKYHDLINMKCDLVPNESGKRLDSFLLVRKFENKALREFWKASRFYFYKSSQNSVCRLKTEDRDKIELWIASLKG